MTQDPAARLAAEVLDLLRERGLTLATAESLTGGGVGAVLTSVPGSSAAYVGGVVSYASRVKVRLLGVPADLVASHGVVSAACARAMAAGVRTVVGADVGVSTTGVAGPDPAEGKPAGLVYVAVAGPSGAAVHELRLAGDRAAVRSAAAQEALLLLREHLRGATASQ